MTPQGIDDAVVHMSRSARVESLTRELAAHAQSKQLDAALQVFATIKREGLEPTSYTYSALINAYVNSGDLQGAQQSLQTMEAAGFHPNLIVFTTLLKGHCAVGDLASARELLESMGRATPPVRPDARTLNTFLRGCVRVGDLDAARWAFSMVESPWQLTPGGTATVAFGRLLSQGLHLGELRHDTSGSHAPCPRVLSIPRPFLVHSSFIPRSFLVRSSFVPHEALNRVRGTGGRCRSTLSAPRDQWRTGPHAQPTHALSGSVVGVTEASTANSTMTRRSSKMMRGRCLPCVPPTLAILPTPPPPAPLALCTSVACSHVVLCPFSPTPPALCMWSQVEAAQRDTELELTVQLAHAAALLGRVNAAKHALGPAACLEPGARCLAAFSLGYPPTCCRHFSH